MSLNEKIANLMGWEYTNKPFPFHDGDHFFDLNDWDAIKAMKQKMVDDGWNISIHHLTEPRELWKTFMAYAYKANGVNVATKWVITERTAIVSLFVKVYGLEV